MKTRIFSFLLAAILLLGLLCSCTNSKGDSASVANSGSSLLTGIGEPSDELGKVGDSYMDVSGDEWGFYTKNEDGWKLLGFLEVDPAPITLNDLNGSYELCYIVSETLRYDIGDNYMGLTLSPDMIQVELQDGVGYLSVNFFSPVSTNMTCTIEYNKLIMICENTINITGQPGSVYELSIVNDGEIYVVLEAYGDYYYVKKVN